MITVAIVDDHPLVRTGLRTVFTSAPDIDVVAEVGAGSEVLDAIREREPAVVLMDLSMPGMDGIEATRLLTQQNLPTRVVALTSFAEDSRVRAAMEAGAVGYLLKDSEPERIIEAVRSAAAGHSPIDARVATTLLARSIGVPPAASSALEVLSKRELDVLTLVVRGLTNRQIATTLGIAERTVKAHLGSIFRALGVGDRTSAAVWAHDHGIR